MLASSQLSASPLPVDQRQGECSCQRLRAQLLRYQGLLNILRYGALTREELEGVIAEIDATLPVEPAPSKRRPPGGEAKP
jgi:hypothetical protein